MALPPSYGDHDDKPALPYAMRSTRRRSPSFSLAIPCRTARRACACKATVATSSSSTDPRNHHAALNAPAAVGFSRNPVDIIAGRLNAEQRSKWPSHINAPAERRSTLRAVAATMATANRAETQDGDENVRHEQISIEIIHESSNCHPSSRSPSPLTCAIRWGGAVCKAEPWASAMTRSETIATKRIPGSPRT